MEGGVQFVARDMPYAKLTIHIVASVAQHEREMSSHHTKAALAEAKKGGYSRSRRRHSNSRSRTPGARRTGGRAETAQRPPECRWPRWQERRLRRRDASD